MTLDREDWDTWGKVGKRQKCPCGSGKIYRDCCRRARKMAAKKQKPKSDPADGVYTLKGDALRRADKIVDTALAAIAVRCTKYKDFPNKSRQLWEIHNIYEAAIRDLLSTPATRHNERETQDETATA